MHDMKHMDFIEDVAKRDIQTLRHKESTYQGSWKKRGGVFAFAMVVRKWDRLDNILERQFGQDIFAGCLADTNGADGSVLAEVRDLRQYLLLVEAEIQSRMAGSRPQTKTLLGESHSPMTIDQIAYADPSNLYDDISRELNIPRPKVKRTIIAYGYQTNFPDDTESRKILDAANRRLSRDHLRVILMRKRDAENNREDSNRHHSDSAHAAEFPMNDVGRAVCSSYRSNYMNGRCMDCGHTKDAHIAKSAIHEPDWDSKAGTKQGDGTWKVKPLISATLFRKLKDPDLISRFIVTGQYAQVDRRRYDEKERMELFRPLSATVSKSDFGRMADADKEFYEPRPGVEGEMQLKEIFRGAWVA
jgi:hypothetical protein